MRAKKRVELVDVIITANNGLSRIPIGDQANLRTDGGQDIVIIGIEAFNINALPLSPVTNNPLPTPAQLANAFLTLYIGQEEAIHLIPVVKLNVTRSSLATATDYFQEHETEFQNLYPVQWDKCYLQLGAPFNAGGANAAFSFLLGITYLKFPPGVWANQVAASKNTASS
jgi:hypothetical protein